VEVRFLRCGFAVAVLNSVDVLGARWVSETRAGVSRLGIGSGVGDHDRLQQTRSRSTAGMTVPDGRRACGVG
jgi:hypothetical protein